MHSFMLILFNVFAFFFFTFSACLTKPFQHVDGLHAEILYYRISNLDHDFGRPAVFQSEVVIINDTDHWYLFNCTRNAKFLVKHEKSGFEVSEKINDPRLLKPQTRDTFFISIPIFEERSEINIDQYLDASLTYLESGDCNIMESIARNFEDQLDIAGEIQIVDRLGVDFVKDSRRIIENNQIN